jgi:hypothetical protein
MEAFHWSLLSLRFSQ